MMQVNQENLNEEIIKFNTAIGGFVVEYNPKPDVLINAFYITATIAAASQGYTKEHLVQFISHVYDTFVNNGEEFKSQIQGKD